MVNRRLDGYKFWNQNTKGEVRKTRNRDRIEGRVEYIDQVLQMTLIGSTFCQWSRKFNVRWKEDNEGLRRGFVLEISFTPHFPSHTFPNSPLSLFSTSLSIVVILYGIFFFYLTIWRKKLYDTIVRASAIDSCTIYDKKPFFRMRTEWLVFAKKKKSDNSEFRG